MIFLLFLRFIFFQPPGEWAEGGFYNLTSYSYRKGENRGTFKLQTNIPLFLPAKHTPARPALNSPLNNPPPPLNNPPF